MSALTSAAVGRAAARWFDDTILDLGRRLRWSYLPPLMIYLAAGVSGLTSVVGTFFVKDYLGLPAAYLAGLAFWAGIPWALKMPLGHLVDLMWRWKALLVWLGAALIAASVLIMYALITHTDAMAGVMSAAAWYTTSFLLAPIGYVLQDVVADAMTVEAVPVRDDEGRPFDEPAVKAMHTTMQTLGRVTILLGFIAVALLNIAVFAGVGEGAVAEKAEAYASIYLAALAIPAVSVAGVVLGGIVQRRRVARLRRLGLDETELAAAVPGVAETTPDWWILGGGIAFTAFILTSGLADIPFNQEIVFVGSMAIVLFLIRQLLREIQPELRGALVGTAVIIFVFRAVPLPGPGVGWWEIDVLGFDEQFLSVLSLVTSALALLGMLLMRPLMARRSIADIVVLLTVAAGVLSLPNIGLYYGLHEWTARHTGGIVDARFIAIIDTALESPLGQIAMVPLLAWIAKNAPGHLKATFFAVMASFTNLALTASSLGTKYLNQVFVVTREVRDRETGAATVPADYDLLGWLLVVVALLTVALPLATVALVQRSPARTTE